ncbi:MAG: PD40 domain-containing protein, partial [Bacteroidia bacterium]|nr:PD40 domain-containing protein [Bacteroidia bacterium]
VLDVSYSEDGENILLSGIRRGQSDLFVYNIRTRTTEQITNDFFDDLNPSFSLDDKFILFSSNRTNDTLGVEVEKILPERNNFDIFLYDYKTKSPTLKRVTNTPIHDEMHPLQLDSVGFSYISNRNGIYNRYISTLDSALAYIDTTEHYRYIIKNYEQSHYNRSVEQHSVNSYKTHYAELFYQDGKQNIYINAVPESNLSEEARVYRPSQIIQYIPPNEQAEVKDENVIQSEPKTKAETDSSKIDINNYLFQSEFEEEAADASKKEGEEEKEKPTSLLSGIISSENAADTLPFRLPKQRQYETSFSTQYFVAQLSNSALNESYQSFSGRASFFDTGINGFIKLGLTDLFDDYRLTGGVKPSFNLNSNEYIAYFENYKKRLDYKLTFYRGARELSSDSLFQLSEVQTHEAKIKLIWPFNDLSSVRFTYGYRNDRQVILSTDDLSLIQPNRSSNYFTNKAEYVYDNTMITGLNLRNGMRMKLFAEVLNEVEEQFNVYVFGLDVRNYTKVHRQIIWANRFAASTSQGDAKLIYYMGALDNTFVPTNNFDDNVQIDQTENYAFQTIATNMRGFLQNIRNGNNFAVINSEVRVPIFEYLFNRPIRSDFLRSMQITTFVDVGTAWTGSSPFADDNSLNIEIIDSQPITVTLQKQIEPVVAGYGFGVRSRVFGYYIKGDWAWGIEDSVRRDLIFYLSLGLDF